MKKEQTSDSRLFNTKVIEIFENHLPKEILPIIIEAHKLRVKRYPSLVNKTVRNLEDAFKLTVNTVLISHDVYFLGLYVIENTVTATDEQLKKWFPSAFKGGQND